MATKPIPSAPMNNPQQTFESALSLVRQGGGRSINPRTRPIAPVRSEQQVEKRALTDAARALATLWHVSPHLVR